MRTDPEQPQDLLWRETLWQEARSWREEARLFRGEAAFLREEATALLHDGQAARARPGFARSLTLIGAAVHCEATARRLERQASAGQAPPR